MEIMRTYEYRLNYSQEVYSATQKMEMEDSTPREAVNAETILLGLKVRLMVLSEVYESGLIDGEDFLANLTSGFKEMLRKSQKEMLKLREKEGTKKKVNYDRYVDYIVDLKYVKQEVEAYIELIKGDEDE